MFIVNDQLAIPWKELHFTFSRSSGPGGQNVNKVNSKVMLHWDVTHSPSLPDPVRERFLARYGRRVDQRGQVLVTSQRFRDQGRNVSDCLAKLQQMLLESLRPPTPRKATRPTRGSQQRRLREKKIQSARKRLRGGLRDRDSGD